MGIVQSTLNWWNTLWKKDSCVLILGLDNAGKTAILYSLKLGTSVDYTVPTLGFNVEEIHVGHLTIHTWDLGGQTQYRALWGHYFDMATGVAFVIDASDRDRFPTVKEEIHRLVSHKELVDKPFVFFANKQDLPHAASKDDLIRLLELNKITWLPWHIVECCALKNERIQVGFEWLAEEI